MDDAATQGSAEPSRPRGAIDGIDAMGRLHGWARPQSNQSFCDVAAICGSITLAHGPANRFRRDLLRDGHGSGWNGFALRLDRRFLRAKTIITVAVADPLNGALICEPRALEVPEGVRECGPLSLSGILAEATETLPDFDALSGLEGAIESFRRRVPTSQFVEYCYCYVLGRPADDGGLKNYVNLLETRKINGMKLLKTLFNSSEFANNEHRPVIPSSPSFPFHG